MVLTFGRLVLTIGRMVLTIGRMVLTIVFSSWQSLRPPSFARLSTFYEKQEAKKLDSAHLA